MNDVTEPARAKPQIVRPRDAASLIVLRGAGNSLELLAGRRPGHVKFMPGMWVFPGGAIDPEDRRPWRIENGADGLPPRLAASARAALRETWEEVRVLVGRAAAALPVVPAGLSPIEAAYVEGGLEAAFDRLVYVGRAITPTRAFRRFNTRFFLSDEDAVFGEPATTDELEDVGWHPIGRRPLEPAADVTHFMLARAIALREGSAPTEAPLFCTVRRKRRILVCREAIRDL
jgi:8-oxo-dGTP pyrophosphatase MutT (NUDIX family)